MLSDVMTALEGTALATGLRNSVWSYPLVNAGHILGVALLVGGIVPLNLRLLGAWKSVPAASLRRVLTRTAGAGFLLAVTCGVLLFITRASEYIGSPVFTAKMIFLCVGIVTTVAQRVMSPEAALRQESSTRQLPVPIRIAAGVSLAVWLAVPTLGRLIGYF